MSPFVASLIFFREYIEDYSEMFAIFFVRVRGLPVYSMVHLVAE